MQHWVIWVNKSCDVAGNDNLLATSNKTQQSHHVNRMGHTLCITQRVTLNTIRQECISTCNASANSYKNQSIATIFRNNSYQNVIPQHNDLTWVPCRRKSTATRLLLQQIFVKNTKVLHYWPIGREIRRYTSVPETHWLIWLRIHLSEIRIKILRYFSFRKMHRIWKCRLLYLSHFLRTQWVNHTDVLRMQLQHRITVMFIFREWGISAKWLISGTIG